MMSPTLQVVPAAGVLMVAVGGVLPTVIVTESVSDAPWLSVTLSEAVQVAAAGVGVASAGPLLESSKAPSPSRSQA